MYLKCKNWQYSNLRHTHVTRQRELTPCLSIPTLLHSLNLFEEQLDPTNHVQVCERQSTTYFVNTSTAIWLVTLYAGKLKMACNVRNPGACTLAHVLSLESARTLSSGINGMFLLQCDLFKTSNQG